MIDSVRILKACKAAYDHVRLEHGAPDCETWDRALSSDEPDVKDRLKEMQTLVRVILEADSLKWTDEPPAVSGWFWMNQGIGPKMEYVHRRPGHLYLCVQLESRGLSDKRMFKAVKQMDASWCGPIVEPK